MGQLDVLLGKVAECEPYLLPFGPLLFQHRQIHNYTEPERVIYDVSRNVLRSVTTLCLVPNRSVLVVDVVESYNGEGSEAMVLGVLCFGIVLMTQVARE